MKLIIIIIGGIAILYMTLYMASYIILCILSSIYHKTNGRIFTGFFHDTLGWHVVREDEIYFDGCNVHGKCTICDKEVIQDSQGNWF